MQTFQKRALCLATLVAAILLIYRLQKEWEIAPSLAPIPSYRRVDWWVLSARCAQSRRVLLVACGPRGELYPIEDVSPTDDRGHVLLLDVLALMKSDSVTRVDLVRMNFLINVAGTLVLAMVLWGFKMPWAAWGTLAAGTWLFPISVRIAGPDVPSAFLGIFCLAAVPALGLGAWQGRWSAGLREWGLLLVGGVSLVMAVLLRQAIGLSGVVAAALLLVWRCLKTWKKSKHDMWISGLLLFGVVTASQSTTILLALRNQWMTLPPAHLIESHGVAHTFYQGLGAVPNPWGITYGQDEDGYNAIRKINPEAGYGTPEYYHEIGKLYFKIVMTQPGAVLRVYLQKLWITLTLPLNVFGVPYGGCLFLAVVVMAVGWRRVPAPPIQLSVAAAFGIYMLVFLSQGVFISPEMRFLYPAKFGVLVLLSLLADFIFCRL